MKKFILAIDQGTTGTTSLLINQETFKIVDKSSKEFPQYFPKSGWVEHQLDEIWETVVTTVKTLLKKNKLKGNEISCIGITNQRETVCSFNKKGKQIHPAIVWQDRRTNERCEELNLSGHKDLFHRKTGLPIDPYFSATKIEWLLNNSSNIQKSLKNKNIHIGTVDSFLVFKLTNHKEFLTDATNASRYLLMDLNKFKWDKELLDIFSIPEEILPQIKDSIGEFGFTENLDFLPDGIPMTGILGDQQAALFGQAGYEKGAIKCTYGTGSFMVLNTGKRPIYSQSGLLTTVGLKSEQSTYYALEGSSYIAGAAVQWLRDQLGFFDESSKIEKLANKIKNDDIFHLHFFPYFSGIGTPHWLPDAKGAITGISRDTGIPHLSRSCLEGIALSIDNLLQSFAESKIHFMDLKVDGGATTNNLLLQTQASFSKINIIRPKVIETTAFGAALAAGLGNKIINDFDLIKDFWKADKTFSPIESSYYEQKKIIWKKTFKDLYLG